MSERHNHIVFFTGAWSLGGVERVTSTLAAGFIERGFRVTIASFSFENCNFLEGLNVRKCKLAAPVKSTENITRLREVFNQDEKIFIVNDWALPFRNTLFLRKVIRGYDAKIITCLHSSPLVNWRDAHIKSKIMRFFMYAFIGINMHFVYRLSDAYVLLSKRYKKPFKCMTLMPCATKLYSIPNPLGLSIPSCEKENAILYVGRLVESSKKISRVLSIWSKIQDKLPNWRLDIVGEGPDGGGYREIARGLERVTFHGFQNPKDYHAKSKLLLLTSDAEGFPMVVLEAMSSGCVPIVYGKIAALYDIVNSKHDGIIIPTPYDEDSFIRAICGLISDNFELERLSYNAKEKVKLFAPDAVVGQWLSLFKQINK